MNQHTTKFPKCTRLQRGTGEEANSCFSQFCAHVENSSEVSRALVFAYVCFMFASAIANVYLMKLLQRKPVLFLIWRHRLAYDGLQAVGSRGDAVRWV